MHRYVVSKRLQRLTREGLVGALDLLQADNIGAAFLEPCLEAIDALTDGIELRGGNSHGFLGCPEGRIRLYSLCLSASAGICTGKRLYARKAKNAGPMRVQQTSHSAE